MKKNYLSELEVLLNQYKIEDIEKTDILDEYSDMYDGWIDSGMSEDEVEEKLGEPSSIIDELMEGTQKKSFRVEKNNDPKIVALMPFVALIIFFTLGFGYDLWHPGWMAFLLIPMVAIIQSMIAKKNASIFIGLLPFICAIIYLILGMYFDLWHPGWIIFLLIPIGSITISNKKKTVHMNIGALSPFIALIGFFIIGELGYYHPGWLIFLIIPIANILHDKSNKMKLLFLICVIAGAAGYLYLYSLEYAWDYSLIAFIPLGLLILFHIYKEMSDISFGYKVCILGSIALYVFLGLEFGLWGYAWLLFLSVPVYAILVEVKDDDKYMALMPFIALTIFFTLGWFFSLWAFAWMAFLIIPMYAILKG